MALFEQDLANVEAGIYPLPADHDGSLFTLLTARGCSSGTFPRSPSAASATARTRC